MQPVQVLLFVLRGGGGSLGSVPDVSIPIYQGYPATGGSKVYGDDLFCSHELLKYNMGKLR